MAGPAWSLLENGRVFQLFGDGGVGAPSAQMVFVDRTESTIYWHAHGGPRRARADHSARLMDLTGISTDKQAHPGLLENHHAEHLPADTFLVLQFEGITSLYLQANSATERDQWLDAILAIQEVEDEEDGDNEDEGSTVREDALTNDIDDFLSDGSERKYNGGGPTPSPGAPNRFSTLNAHGSIPEEDESAFADEPSQSRARRRKSSVSRSRPPPSPMLSYARGSPPPSLDGSTPSASPYRPFTNPRAPNTPILPVGPSQSRGVVVSGKRLPIFVNPRLAHLSAFDRHVLPIPLPPDQRLMVDTALTAVRCAAFGVLKQKQDELTRVAELEAQMAQNELNWNSLAVSNSAGQRGKIEIRLAVTNLEHEEPHQYVALLYIKHPLEETFEYSQTVSLMRSPDGSTYLPRLMLSPTELFAFRHAEEDEEEDYEDYEDDEAQGYDEMGSVSSFGAKRSQKSGKKAREPQEGQLVGAHLKIEIWDLINKQLYGDEYDALNSSRDGADSASGYQGHVDFDMTELLAAQYHVMALPILNAMSAHREREWATQGIKLVMQYALPHNEVEEDPVDRNRGQDAPNSVLAAGCTDPLMTLRLNSLEDDIGDLQAEFDEFAEQHEHCEEQTIAFAEERKVRQALEARLVSEQVIRVKHEQENMRLKPRALELADTSDELVAAKKRMAEMDVTIDTLQKELKKLTIPPSPHAMLDELLHLSNPALVDLLRIKRFVLEQERVRAMLVEEMSSGSKHYITFETTHDEMTRRQNALQTHCQWLEDEKRKLETQNAELIASLHQLQHETVQLSQRCEVAEAAAEHTQVNMSFLTEQQKVHLKKIDELERGLLVHHGQLEHFEYARAPVPQHQQYAMRRPVDEQRDYELEQEHDMQMDREMERRMDQQLSKKADQLLNRPSWDQPDAQGPPPAIVYEYGPEKAAAAEAVAGAALAATAATLAAANGADGAADESVPVVPAPPAPRRTKIVYSASLEQSLAAAAASNWK